MRGGATRATLPDVAARVNGDARTIDTHSAHFGVSDTSLTAVRRVGSRCGPRARRRGRRLRTPGRGRSGRAATTSTSLAFGGLPGREGGRLAVEVDPLETLVLLDFDLHVVVETRAEPAGEQLRLRGGAAHADRLHRADPRPQRREQRAPALGALPRDVRAPDRLEQLRQAVVAGGQPRPTRSSRRSAGRRSRSAGRTPPSPSPARRASGRTPADPRSAAATRSTQAPLRVRRAASARSPRRRPPDRRRESTAARRRTSSPSGSSGFGTSSSVRDGCRSAIPASVSSAASCHSGGAHAMCVITDVRRFGCAPSSAVSYAQPRELALDRGDRDVRPAPVGLDDAQWRRHDRPSRCNSSSDALGPHVPAG